MKILEIANWIADIMKDNLPGLTVKVSPEAIYAPTSFSMTNANNIVLVWYDSSPIFRHPERNTGGKFISNSQYVEYLRYVISVGYKSLANAPQNDELIEKIIDELAGTYGEGISELMPVSVSRLVIDENQVYWRQIFIETTRKKRI